MTDHQENPLYLKTVGDPVYNCFHCGKNMFRDDVADCPRCSSRHAIMSPADAYQGAEADAARSRSDDATHPIIIALILVGVAFAIVHFGFGWSP